MQTPISVFSRITRGHFIYDSKLVKNFITKVKLFLSIKTTPRRRMGDGSKASNILNLAQMEILINFRL
jgi:hypothetical protein